MNHENPSIEANRNECPPHLISSGLREQAVHAALLAQVVTLMYESLPEETVFECVGLLQTAALAVTC